MLKSCRHRRMIAAVLLAAGESSRMGEPKQLLDWQGQSLVTAQSEALLAAGCRPLVVVLGAHAARVRPHVPDHPNLQIVTNHAWRSGRASSIRAGSRAMPSEINAVAVVSVDQPTTAAVVERLAESLSRAPDAEIVVPRYGGRNGHPPMFSARLLPQLRQVSERGEGLREIRRSHADATIFLDMDDPIVRLNLNTPEAYHHALELL